jgi:ribose 1,5-bisphosphokinase PhnN
MTHASADPVLTDYLASRGYSPEEIEKILARLARYDHKTLSDAVFDSIGNNAQTLDQIIRDALREE